MSRRPELHRNLIQEVTSIAGTALYQIEVVRQKGNHSEDTQHLCATSKSVLVDLNLSRARPVELNLYETLSILSRYSRPNHGSSGIVGDQL